MIASARSSSRGRLRVSRHVDNDLAARVSLLHAAQALGRTRKCVGSVDDRRELPALGGFGHGEQLLPLVLRRSGRNRCETNGLATTALRRPTTGPNT